MALQDINEPIIFRGCFVKRATATMGINGSPSSVDLELVSPTSPTAGDIAYGASGFQAAAVRPGTLTSIAVSGFKFAGLVQAWNENLSIEGGRIYSVRLVDPRLCFDNVVVALDGQTTSVYTDNYADVFGYYGDPVSAGASPGGVRWSKIRQYFENTSGINLYGNRCRLVFSSGFYPIVSGVPTWFRCQGGQTTLSAVLNQVAEANNFDYYAYFDPTGYNPTGITPIHIQHIYRRTNSNLSAVSGYLQGLQNSGTLMNYRYGEELRSDPTTFVVQGAPITSWVGAADGGSDIRCYWGRTPDGTAITNDNGAASGVVLLEHLVGTGTAGLPSITLPILNISKLDTGAYPAQTVIQYTTQTFKGFCPTINTMRAALHSQEAWESMFYYEDPIRASGCGIYENRFMTYAEWAAGVVAAGGNTTNPTGSTNLYINGIYHTLQKFSADIFQRETLTDLLVGSVYQAVREVAERYYGLSWMTKLQSSTWLQSNTFDSTELYPGIEYTVASAAWAENSALPYGIPNHPGLLATGSTILKDENGLLRPIFSTPQYVRTSGYSVQFPYVIDTRKLVPEAYWLEASGSAGAKFVMPISCQAYEKYPVSGIVSFPFVLEGIVSTSGTKYDDQKSFYAFLKAVGYPDHVIDNFNLIDTIDDNTAYGLCPPRLNHIKSQPSAGYGLYIPIVSKTTSYGPFIATGVVPGGARLVIDSSLQPASYGGLLTMYDAGNDILDAAGSSVTVVDSADVTVAGLPERNLGEIVGDSAVISSISMQYGIDGFTTAYGLRTYVFAPGKVTRLLTDKVAKMFNVPVQNREKIDFDRIRNEPVGSIYRPDQIGPSWAYGPDRNASNYYDGRTLDRPAPNGTWIGGQATSGNMELYQ